MFNRNILLAGFALAGALAGPSAHAQVSLSDDNVHQKRVSFSDLDLAGAAGAKTLMFRLHHAADEVCGRWDGSADKVGINICVRDAVARAVKHIDKPTLTALLDNKPAMQIASIGSSQR